MSTEQGGEQPQPEQPRPRRRVAMTDGELDAFLAEERTCRVATVRGTTPHLTALWFVWHGGSLWLYSIADGRRWRDLERNPQVAVLIDAGREYTELRSVELRGSVEVVGEVPRTGEPLDELAGPETAFAEKYVGARTLQHDHRHAWLRLNPSSVRSWDFRKT